MPAAALVHSQVRLHSVADVGVRAMCVADHFAIAKIFAVKNS